MEKKEILYKVWNWWKASAEGKNQTASGRRLSALAITILYILLRLIYVASIIVLCVYAIKQSNTTAEQIHSHIVSAFRWQLFGLAADIIFIGLLWGYINQQGIIEFKNGYKYTKEQTKDKTTETLEKTDGSDNSSNISQQ